MAEIDLEALAARVAELEDQLEGALQRATRAEDRFHNWRSYRTARSKTLADFIKARAPDLWPDYAALSVNGSLYGDHPVEPTYERAMNTLRHRAEKAEEEAAALRARLMEGEGENA